MPVEFVQCSRPLPPPIHSSWARSNCWSCCRWGDPVTPDGPVARRNCCCCCCVDPGTGSSGRRASRPFRSPRPSPRSPSLPVWAATALGRSCPPVSKFCRPFRNDWRWKGERGGGWWWRMREVSAELVTQPSEGGWWRPLPLHGYWSRFWKERENILCKKRKKSSRCTNANNVIFRRDFWIR